MAKPLNRIIFRRPNSWRQTGVDCCHAANQFAILHGQQIGDAAAGFFARHHHPRTIDIVFLQHVVQSFADEL